MKAIFSRLPAFVLAALLLAFGSAARAQLSIEITGAGANQTPIVVANFAGEEGISQALTSVIRTDLERCGLFRMIDPGLTPLSETAPVDYAKWKGQGADALVAGSVTAMSDGRYETRFRLYDVQAQTTLGGQAYISGTAQLRATAHHISDFIYQKLTGIPGVFSTRIAYVVKTPHRWELQVADEDGANAQTALASHEPIISPTWAPGGKRLAYVSFEMKKPIIYVHSLATGKRHVIANFRGSNSAPAWSPDGKKLAIVLSKDGPSQMYLINPDGSDLKRLEVSTAIDTEPTFSPDGKWIYFTSDRGGSPQIYRMPVTGGLAQRITFQGNYNVTPRISPDGKSMAYIARTDGLFQVALMDLATGQTQILTSGPQDESPSFAPNGQTIMYATRVNGRGMLATVSIDGSIRQRLSLRAADVREPAWGPFMK